MIYLEAVSALALVIGLIGLFYYLGQRLNERITGGASKRQIQVIERAPLGDKRTLVLIRVGRQQLLLGATNSRISMLSEVACEEHLEKPSSESAAEENGESKISFRRILEAMR